MQRPATAGFNHRALVSICCLMIGSIAHAQQQEYLYVENTFGGDVTVIDVATHEVVSTIPVDLVGHHPDDVVASPDGKVIYINRLDKNDIIAISTITEQPLWRVEVSGTPHHMAISSDGKFLYAPIFTGAHVEVIDTRRQQVVGRIPTAYGGHCVELSKDGERLYTGHLLSDQIVISSTQTGEPLRAIHTDEGIRPFAVLDDESRLFAQLSKLHGFVVFDLENADPPHTVHLPKMQIPDPLEWPHTLDHGLVVTPDEKLLFLAGTLSNSVAVYALPELKLLKVIPTGQAPGWLSVNADGRFVYASNREEDTVSVISVADLTELKRIKVGDFPQRMTTAIVPYRQVAADAIYYPDKDEDWKRRTPQEIGWDAAKLQEAIEYAQQNDGRSSEIHTEADMIANQERVLAELLKEPNPEVLGPMKAPGGVNGLILYRGAIVAEFGDTREVEMTASLSKSILSTAGGLVFDQGMLPDLNEPMARLVKDGGFDSDHNAAITWHQLFQQTSEWKGELWSKDDRNDMRKDRERVHQAPGAFWEYNDVRVNRLALALLRVSGRSLVDVLRDGMMEPIGATDSWRWHGYRNSYVEIDGQKVQSVSGGGHWGGGFWANAYDLARIGYLFQRRGRWKDKQIISERWIDQATMPCDLNANYGYLWWLNTDGYMCEAAPSTAYSARGGGGHYIWVDHENELVVAVHNLAGGQPIYGGFLTRIYEAMNE